MARCLIIINRDFKTTLSITYKIKSKWEKLLA